jgi:hypothetical protein
MALPFRFHALTVALLGVMAAAPTCGGSSDAMSERGGGGPTSTGDDAPPPEETSFGDDAAAGSQAVYRGNPLCRVAPGDCMPDDDGQRLTSGAMTCAVAEPDGGVDEGPVFGCRLIDDYGDPAPACLQATRSGKDGAACGSGDECAPGFDCTDAEGGSVCRRYCCAGTCGGYLSRNGGSTFCDVQRLSDTGRKAPVCMPIKQCELLKDGACAATETCAVVTETGDTGCVAIGPQQVGQSCDESHCAAGLTCLGQPGNRKCYELCKVSAGCGSAMTCMTVATFKDPQYGVCQ